MTTRRHDGAQAAVCVFAPSPLLTVTIESRGRSAADVHLHPGGQGPWITNMVAVLEVPVTVCGPFGGETGRVLRALMARDHVDVRAVETESGNGCYVEDARSGEQRCLAEMPPAVLNRHEVDDLLSQTLAAALASRVTVLTGPVTDAAASPEVYRRLAGDLAALDVTVVADLSGHALTAALDAGVSVLKVSHEELLADGLATGDSVEDLLGAMEALSKHVRQMLVVTRADQPTLALVDGVLLEVRAPVLQPVHHRGAGDSMTAGIAVALARGEAAENALRLGAAAGAGNVLRRGLASGQRETIERLTERVTVAPADRVRGDGV